LVGGGSTSHGIRSPKLQDPSGFVVERSVKARPAAIWCCRRTTRSTLKAWLIPVRWLMNERTVAPARRMRHVEYFHVELDQHAVLLAEGMPAESYLDTGDRSTFENGGVAVELYPDFASRTWESGGCARLVVTGPEVTAVRQRLQQHADRNGPVVRRKNAAAW
jgi:hypothetical protein